MTSTPESARKVRARRSSPRQPTLPTATLDQDEVLRSMLKAKGPSGVPAGYSHPDEVDSDDVADDSTNENEDVTARVSSEAHRRVANGHSKHNGVKRSMRPLTSDEAISEPANVRESILGNAEASTSRVRLSSLVPIWSNGKGKSPMVGENIQPQDTTFASLGLSQPLISALETINIRKPTEIQLACIGPILEGKLPGPGRAG